MPSVRKRFARVDYRSADEFRELAVTNALSGQVSIAALADIYGIGRSTLYRWAADSRRELGRGRLVSSPQDEADQVDQIRRERDAFRIVALALARDLSRDL